MAMKKIKPQYGKVNVPNAKSGAETGNEFLDKSVDSRASGSSISEGKSTRIEETSSDSTIAESPMDKAPKSNAGGKSASRVTSVPNPFLQSKEVFSRSRLTKIGYRMRTDYVEILDIIKKIKKSGYTLEAVLDDALTYYFENSEDGKEALRKAEIFYS